MDLLVMENLFHSHEIIKTYDLKGIGECPWCPFVDRLLTDQKVERLRNLLLHRPELPKPRLLDQQLYGMGTGSKPFRAVLF